MPSFERELTFLSYRPDYQETNEDVKGEEESLFSISYFADL